MPKPRFLFVDGGPPPSADAQFWRDVDTSERLGSRSKANLFLRDLCRSKAWEAATPGADLHACAATERRLLRDVSARGYRVFGPDLDHAEMPPLAEAG